MFSYYKMCYFYFTNKIKGHIDVINVIQIMIGNTACETLTLQDDYTSPVSMNNMLYIPFTVCFSASDIYIYTVDCILLLNLIKTQYLHSMKHVCLYVNTCNRMSSHLKLNDF